MRIEFQIPRIYPITDTALTGLSHLEQVKRLIDGGADLIQLREKQRAPADFFDDAADAVKYARSRGVTLLINDRVDIAVAVDADGVHLGQTDLPPEAARRILGPKAVIGFSTHSVEQAIEAVKMPVDYIAIGPIFPTGTKTDPDPVVGLDGLAAVRSAVGEKALVAIGGIKESNLRSVFAAGADSAAIVSGVLVPSDAIIRNMHQLREIAK